MVGITRSKVIFCVGSECSEMFRRNLVRDSGKLAAPFLFSELLHHLVRDLPRYSKSWKRSRRDRGVPRGICADFSRTLRPAATVRASYQIPDVLEVQVSRNLTSAGARKNCRVHCPVKAGRQGVCDIHKSPSNLLMVGKLGISIHDWRRGGWFRCLEFASYHADLHRKLYVSTEHSAPKA